MYFRRTICVILTGILVLLTSCSSPTGELQDASGEVKITSQDLEQEHIKLKLLEKVSVDADITPYSKYKDGLSAYYLSPHTDNHKKTDIKAYRKNPVLFNQSAEKVKKLIEEFDGGKFSLEEKVKVEKEWIKYVVSYRNASGEKKQMNCTFANDKGQFAGTEFYLEGVGCSGEYSSIGKSTLKDDPFYKEESFSFAACDEVERKIRTLVEQITGRKLAEESYCIPITEERYHTVMKAEKEDEADFPYSGEYYVVLMHFDIDGFPWKQMDIPMMEENGMELSDDIVLQEGQLFAREEWRQVAAYNADGLISLELDSFWYQGATYKEKEKVCTVEDILERTKTYFEDVLLKEPVTIYNISIAYSSYFTEPEEGVIKNVVRPFWVVTYWDGEQGTKLVFDAYSGKYLTKRQA